MPCHDKCSQTTYNKQLIHTQCSCAVSRALTARNASHAHSCSLLSVPLLFTSNKADDKLNLVSNPVRKFIENYSCLIDLFRIFLFMFVLLLPQNFVIYDLILFAKGKTLNFITTDVSALKSVLLLKITIHGINYLSNLSCR